MHPPGFHRIGNRSYFTLYAPYAQKLRLALFERCEDKKPKMTYPMRAVGDGFWEYSDIRSFEGYYYAFLMNGMKEYIADPYARCVATFNDFRQEARGFICDTSFDWEGDTFIALKDPRDLIIYECHVRDLTAADGKQRDSSGTYSAVKDRIGYFRKLGVNAVEFMPLMHFANHEPPFKEEAGGIYNDWNPYAYNHWGYMTSFFFAPANFYARKGTRQKHRWSDARGEEIRELKSMVRALHAAGIAVIMDVVYNHISQYDRNPLRWLAEDHYLRPGENHSGCGNDVNSESPVMRRLILDSIRYWTQEFHIDGFRLDLAGILDDRTLHELRETARGINPDTVIVGEAWGKRYIPGKMSELGLGAWNDRFRNGIKGAEPREDPGYLFGLPEKGTDKDHILQLLSGSLKEDGGIVRDSKYSVNYLACHDEYTLGDFIRLSLREGKDIVPEDHAEHIRLSEEEKVLHHIAAFILCCSQGVCMLHAGQEYARSKVIARVDGVEDPQAGTLDRDSYAKDNGTNYMDLHDREINRELYDYYRQLLAVRKVFPELRSAERDRITWLHGGGSDHGVGYRVDVPGRSMAVLLNSSPEKAAEFDLQEGDWKVHAHLNAASTEPLSEHKDAVLTLAPRSVLLLIKHR